MRENKYDVVVVGGGPAGYVAAIRAGQLGLKTALIEKEQLGGVCLNWGCIPTKALLRTAEVARLLNEADSFGFHMPKGHTFDLKKAVQRSRDISSKLSQGIAFLLKKNKVIHIAGHARLMGEGHLQIAQEDSKIDKLALEANHIILATGAHARTIPGVKVDGQKIWTAKEAMIPKKLPKSMLIVGSGAIGIEFASFYRNAGVSDVTVVEMQDHILPVEDPEISKAALKALEKQGIKFHTSTTLEDLQPTNNGVSYKLKSSGATSNGKADVALLAIGIVGNTENLGLENTKVEVEKSHIVVKDFGATHEPGVYAIGDVAGPPWLAHKGSHEGMVCVNHIAKQPGGHKLDPTKIPGCTYSVPQIASVGYTEPAAKKAGYETKIGRFNFQANGKALAMGEPEGMVKVIFDAKTGELLGAHMLGAEVTELIQGFVIARSLEATEEDLMNVVFPHPTLSEMMHEAVLDAYARAIHH